MLIRCLTARRAVVLAEGLDAGALIEVMRASRVTLVSLVAPMLAGLLEAGEAPPSLRVVLLGGGPCPTRLVGAARLAGWPVVTTYGLTETCSQVATQAPGRVEDPEEVAAPPLDGVEVRIVDGRIQVRGDMLMAGYFPRGRHDEPFTDDGFLDTGDLGMLDERGRLHVLGRADDVIVTGGENVSPARGGGGAAALRGRDGGGGLRHAGRAVGSRGGRSAGGGARGARAWLSPAGGARGPGTLQAPASRGMGAGAAPRSQRQARPSAGRPGAARSPAPPRVGVTSVRVVPLSRAASRGSPSLVPCST